MIRNLLSGTNITMIIVHSAGLILLQEVKEAKEAKVHRHAAKGAKEYLLL